MNDVNGAVLITDGNERSALAAVRSLGDKGIRTIVGAETTSSIAGASRYCADTVVYPSPWNDEEGFVAVLRDTCRWHRITTLYPMTDLVMQHVQSHRAVFENRTTLPIASPESFTLASDKYRIMALAKNIGVPIPQSLFVPDGNIDQYLTELPAFPLIVKPARSVVRENGKWTRTSVHCVNSADELLRLFRTIPYLRNPSVIQKRIQGGGVGVFALANDGDPVVLFAHRRLREKPPAGGVSVLRESIALPQPATEYAVRLLRHLKWHGVAMVEFKEEERTGVPMLMEINARFWGSLQLAIDAGIDFPHALYRLVTEGKADEQRDYIVGQRLRWLLGDLDHLLMRLFHSSDQLRLPPVYPSRFKTLVDFLKWDRRTRWEVLRWDDPGPFLFELRRYVRDLARLS